MNLLMAASLLFYVLLLVFSIIANARRGRRGDWAVYLATILVSVHALIYYTTYLTLFKHGVISNALWNNWSSALRLHGLITMVGIIYFQMRTGRNYGR